VMKVVRDGQQSGNEAKLFSKVVPRAPSSARTFVMTRIDSTVWSSVIRTRTFGRAWDCWSRGDEAATASPLKAEEASVAESASTDSDAARTPNALGRMPAIHELERERVVSGS
jgi:hypothetical protein